ncbi:MAG: LptF/LptG family permease [Bacteroidales bacterium]|nr:LptF/LptG family permease [Bacteroidales bacterium]
MKLNKKKYGFLSILDVYIIKKLLLTFIMAILLIIMIAIIFDLSERLDDFISNNAPIKGLIFDYYLNFIPHFANLFGHLFFFIAVVFVCSKLASNSEIIAVLSSGISFKRLLRPFILTAVFVGLVNLWLSNVLIPKVNVPRLEFEKVYYRNPYSNQFYNIHLQPKENEQIYVQHFSNKTNKAYKFTQEIIQNGEIIKKTYADHIIFDSSTMDWIMMNYHIRNINKKEEIIEKGDNKHIDIGVLPNEFNLNQIKVEVLDYKQLDKSIEREELKGNSVVTELKIEKYQRLLNPFAYVILTVIGVALSSHKKRGGIGLNLAMGIILAFSLIMMMKLTNVFATNSSLSPFFATALPLLIYAVIAIVLVRKTPK